MRMPRVMASEPVALLVEVVIVSLTEPEARKSRPGSDQCPHPHPCPHPPPVSTGAGPSILSSFLVKNSPWCSTCQVQYERIRLMVCSPRSGWRQVRFHCSSVKLSSHC